MSTDTGRAVLCFGVSIRLGVMMARSGAAAFRVREAIGRTARALGGTDIHVVVHPDSISMTATFGATALTRVVRLGELGVNMSRLCQLEVLSRELVKRTALPEPVEVAQALDRIESAPLLYPRWSTIPLLGISCAAFCTAIGGNSVQIVATFVGTSLGHIVRLRLLRMHPHPPVQTLVVSCAFVSALSAYAFVRLAPHLPGPWAGMSPVATPAIVASVLYLIPGVPLVTSLLDVLHFDLNAGLARGAFAALIVVCIAIGILVLYSMVGFEVGG